MERSLYTPVACLALSLLVLVFVALQQNNGSINEETMDRLFELRMGLEELKTTTDVLSGDIKGLQNNANSMKETLDSSIEVYLRQITFGNWNEILVELKEDVEILKKGFESLKQTSPVEKAKLSSRKTFHLGLEDATWEEAKTKCESLNLQLASIDSWEEQASVEAMIKEAASYGIKKDFWTSGCDMNRREYRWEISGKPMTYWNWQKGEPNNAYNIVNDDVEHCVSLDFDFDYRWNDNFCSGLKYFVCEQTA